MVTSVLAGKPVSARAKGRSEIQAAVKHAARSSKKVSIAKAKAAKAKLQAKSKISTAEKDKKAAEKEKQLSKCFRQN